MNLWTVQCCYQHWDFQSCTCTNARILQKSYLSLCCTIGRWNPGEILPFFVLQLYKQWNPGGNLPYISPQKLLRLLLSPVGSLPKSLPSRIFFSVEKKFKTSTGLWIILPFNTPFPAGFTHAQFSFVHNDRSYSAYESSFTCVFQGLHCILVTFFSQVRSCFFPSAVVWAWFGVFFYCYILILSLMFTQAVTGMICSWLLGLYKILTFSWWLMMALLYHKGKGSYCSAFWKKNWTKPRKNTAKTCKYFSTVSWFWFTLKSWI